MAAKIKKGNTVKVIAGDDKGTTAKVLKVLPDTGKALVKGVNMCWKHVRPSKKNPQGGRLQIERPVNMSNLKPVSE
ncbi:MAG: 50S ribosomal protein L24 [Phycisphaerae bacterium]|nr:50S ribosomal protein L24 [Phycisphaerae bacterium]